MLCFAWCNECSDDGSLHQNLVPYSSNFSTKLCTEKSGNQLLQRHCGIVKNFHKFRASTSFRGTLRQAAIEVAREGGSGSKAVCFSDAPRLWRGPLEQAEKRPDLKPHGCAPKHYTLLHGLTSFRCLNHANTQRLAFPGLGLHEAWG